MNDARRWEACGGVVQGRLMGLEIDVPAFGVFEILSDILSSESDTSGCSEDVLLICSAYFRRDVHFLDLL